MESQTDRTVSKQPNGPGVQIERGRTAPSMQVGGRGYCQPHCNIRILTAPGSRIFSLVSFTETLDRANEVLGRSYYRLYFPMLSEWNTMGQPLLLGSVVENLPDDRKGYQFTMILADGKLGKRQIDFLRPTIAAARRTGSRLIAVGSAVFALARLGMFNDDTCAVHPEFRGLFSELFPRVAISNDLFHFGRMAASCCGNVAALELALAIVARDFGAGTCRKVRSLMLLARPSAETRHIDNCGKADHIANKHVRAAIEIIGRNTEAKVDQADIARRCAISSRQMQRLFKQHTGMTFVDFHMNLRLDKARQLLEHSDMSMIEIALACGFSGGSYFSKSFRDRWGTTPSRMRQRLQERNGLHMPDAPGAIGAVAALEASVDLGNEHLVVPGASAG